MTDICDVEQAGCHGRMPVDGKCGDDIRWVRHYVYGSDPRLYQYCLIPCLPPHHIYRGHASHTHVLIVSAHPDHALAAAYRGEDEVNRRALNSHSPELVTITCLKY